MRRSTLAWLPLALLVGARLASADPPPKAPRAHASRPKAQKSAPIASRPGFEALEGGGSRVFVHLSKTVAVEERKAPGQLVYVLRGARSDVRNDQNPLVTVHFDTPVARVQLRPAGPDLWLVIELRAPAQPIFRLAPDQDGAAILQVEFAKGANSPKDAAKPADDGAKDAPKS
jgi:hypothetical protein